MHLLIDALCVTFQLPYNTLTLTHGTRYLPGTFAHYSLLERCIYTTMTTKSMSVVLNSSRQHELPSNLL